MNDINNTSAPADYIKRIDELADDMVRDLQGLIRIPSKQGQAEEGKPFGPAVDEAFRYMLALGKREGFAVRDVDALGGHIDYFPEEAPADIEKMGILCHLDVVPEGSDWDHDPYGAEIVDGMIVGRGTQDDKGPAISAFYAMKALKDCGYAPAKGVRMVLGLDEETGSTGMHHYLAKVGAPDFALTPDAEFPLVHGEMGIMTFDLVKKLGKPLKGGYTLKSITGGNAANMVADTAQAVISSDESYTNIKNMVLEYCERTGHNITAKGRGKSLELNCTGISAHGAQPWKGLNAISVLMEFLSEIDFNCGDVNDFIGFYNDHIGYNLHGEAIECALSDEVSGKLIWNVGKISLTTEAARLTVNVRCPIELCDDDVYEAISPVIGRYDIGVVKNMYQPPIYFSLDLPMVKTLVEVYRNQTGDMESKPLVIGGGTYARDMKNAMAFGMLRQGEPDLMHQKNEAVSIENLITNAKIYAEAIYRLAVKPDAR